MRIGIIPAQDAKTVPSITRGPYDEAETFIKGAVLGVNSDGELVELATGAGVTGVVGVSLEDVDSGLGHNVANDNLVVWRTGVESEVSYVDLTKNPHQVFAARLTDGSGNDDTPTKALLKESRGLLLLASGEWTVNNADVTNDVVQIVDIVLVDGATAHGNYVLFRFLSSVLAIAANVS